MAEPDRVLSRANRKIPENGRVPLRPTAVAEPESKNLHRLKGSFESCWSVLRDLVVGERQQPAKGRHPLMLLNAVRPPDLESVGHSHSELPSASVIRVETRNPEQGE
jgi:hypothetical protein